VTVTATVSVETAPPDPVPASRLLAGPVLALVVVGFLLLMALGVRNNTLGAVVLALLAVFAGLVWHLKRRGVGTVDGHSWHELLEGRAVLFTVLVLVSVLIGGMVQILPTVLSDSAIPMERNPTPYSGLELAGREIYIREGCYLCHTQMIRELSWESLRYGKPTESWESKYDHPFQWGSKRNGPDLQRVGGKYPDLWHWKHLMDPRSISQGSIMPGYSFLAAQKVDPERIVKTMVVMRKIGVPYTDADVASATADARAQATAITDGLKDSGVNADPGSELVALIAYLQKLGRDNK